MGVSLAMVLRPDYRLSMHFICAIDASLFHAIGGIWGYSPIQGNTKVTYNGRM